MSTSNKNNKPSKSNPNAVRAPAVAAPVAPPPPAAVPAIAAPPSAPPTPPPPLGGTTTNLPPNVALVAYVAQSVAQIDVAEAALAVDPPTLTSTQKRRAAKLRSGGDKAVAQIATLAKQYGVESSVLQADAMSLALADAQALAPLMVRIQAFEKHVADLLFLWQGAAWEDAMQFYALLQRRSLVDGSLAASLAPVAAFFAKRHASTKAGKPPKRTAKANKKAVNRLKKAAPQLLAGGGAGGGGAAAPAAAPATASPAPAAAPSPVPAAPAPTNGATPAAHS
jgi:hypothetical protein